MTSADRWHTEKPWTMTAEQAAERLEVSPGQGLSQGEARKRLQECGPNRLRQAEPRSAWLILFEQFKSLIVLFLVLAAGLAFLYGSPLEGAAIAVALAVNAFIGFATELRAARSMEALYQMSRVTTKVRREGNIQKISAENLVPGDIVILESGDIVSADLRLWEANKLQADESALTGESVPVGKGLEVLGEDVPLAARKNLMFKGTAVTRGSGAGVVVATGMETELGEISSLVEEAEDENTPMEKRLDQLGYRLVWLTLALGLALIASGYFAGKNIILVVETAIALAVAAIPEGLPVVATLALARGMRRMAKRNALVNRLSAIETLGSVNIIFTDKTGTLTENRMTVDRLAILGDNGEVSEAVLASGGEETIGSEMVKQVLQVGVLCNNASLSGKDHKGEGQAVGDPLEIALLEAGTRFDLRRESLLESLPEAREEAFDPETKMMATFHRQNGSFLVAVKGAPEAVLEVCRQAQGPKQVKTLEESDKAAWLEVNRRLAAQGLRMLALARKEAPSESENPYENLTLLGLAALLDPPRKDVPEAIAACQKAGIRVVMVTGDQPETARHIGREVGLVEGEDAKVVLGRDVAAPESLSREKEQELLQSDIFARVSPKQKLDLISLQQDQGLIIAMTGDGVNDAPGLKKADIGIAMGQRGTQVAKESADIILKDDAFGTIVLAIEYGRSIFGNIRKFIFFLLSGNVSEILIVAVAWLVGATLPLLPLQILYLNMIGDVFPALALGVGGGDPAVMQKPPRDPGEPVLTRWHWLAIGLYGILIAAVVLAAFALALERFEFEPRLAVTVSFLTLAFSRLWHVFNMRDQDSGLIVNEITKNHYVWGALVLCVFLLLMGVYVPGLSTILTLVDPGPQGWTLILIMSFIPLLVGQTAKTVVLFASVWKRKFSQRAAASAAHS